MVSPPRLMSMRPMSLLTANISIGMGRTTDAPDNVVLRKAIWTSAEMPFVNTLFENLQSMNNMNMSLLTEDSP